jgi:hypothetical protein
MNESDNVKPDGMSILERPANENTSSSDCHDSHFWRQQIKIGSQDVPYLQFMEFRIRCATSLRKFVIRELYIRMSILNIVNMSPTHSNIFAQPNFVDLQCPSAREHVPSSRAGCSVGPRTRQSRTWRSTGHPKCKELKVLASTELRLAGHILTCRGIHTFFYWRANVALALSQFRDRKMVTGHSIRLLN